MRGRDAVVLRDGEQVATVVDLPWEEEDRDAARARTRGRGTARARGRPRAGKRRRGRSPRRARGRSTRARASSRRPASRTTSACARSGGGEVSYGDYGGRYVPETLIPALDELDAGWREARADSVLRRRARPARPRVRRPADAADARRALRPGKAPLPEARGPDAHRRAQAEQRARPGRARPAAREDADHRRDRRGPARRRDRDGLRPLRARVRRLHGRRGHAPPAPERRADGTARRRGAPGRVRDEDAEGGDERGDPGLDHERREHALPDRLVRRPGAVPGARRASCRR